MKKNIKRFRSRVKTQGLKITKEGRYWFKVRLKEKKSEKKNFCGSSCFININTE